METIVRTGSDGVDVGNLVCRLAGLGPRALEKLAFDRISTDFLRGNAWKTTSQMLNSFRCVWSAVRSVCSRVSQSVKGFPNTG